MGKENKCDFKLLSTTNLQNQQGTVGIALVTNFLSSIVAVPDDGNMTLHSYFPPYKTDGQIYL